MSAKCSGVELNPEGPYLSLEKEKENFCAVFTHYSSIERALQRRLRNVQKSVMYVQSCCFVLVVVAVVVD